MILRHRHGALSRRRRFVAWPASTLRDLHLVILVNFRPLELHRSVHPRMRWFEAPGSWQSRCHSLLSLVLPYPGRSLWLEKTGR